MSQAQDTIDAIVEVIENHFGAFKTDEEREDIKQHLVVALIAVGVL